MNTQLAPTKTQTSKAEINALHNKFQTYGQNAKHWLRQCQMLLPRIRDEEVWKKKGFSSIYEYAAKLAGMSHASVDDALFVLDRIEDKPHLMRIAGERGINAIRPVVTIATKETEEFWARRAEEMSNNTLREYVAGMRRGAEIQGEIESRDIPSQRVVSQDGSMSNGEFCLGDSGDCEVSEEGSDTAGDKKTASVYMKLEVEVIEKLKQIKGDRDWNELMKDLLGGKVENIHGFSGGGSSETTEGSDEKSESGDAARHSERQEKPAPVNTGKRYMPKKIKKYVTKKTSGLCAYPGCTKPYGILHHTKRFAIDSTHDPDSLAPLCKAHERLAHSGLIEGEEKSPVEFVGGEDGGDCVGEGELPADKAEIKINWALRKQPDKTSRKYEIDKKVNEYYAPRLE